MLANKAIAACEYAQNGQNRTTSVIADVTSIRDAGERVSPDDHLCASTWAIKMLIAVAIRETVAITSAIVALILALSAAKAARSAASEARRASSICSALEASLRASASLSFAESQVAVRRIQ